ncbi:MAG TPA: hypothetical protein VL307_20275, partial [Chitinophagaceae bacterium]|nr:hypothetical protein [Chitinophagaceae bacterium]
VSFKESVDPRQLQAIPGVDNLLQTGPHDFEITGADSQQLKNALLALSLQQNLNIVSLQSGEQKLEEVFRTLTGNNPESTGIA